MNFPNITQATYDRLIARCQSGEQQTNLDVSDLLEAYESAALLLEQLARSGRRDVSDDVFYFLNTDNGDPRVELHSHKG